MEIGGDPTCDVLIAGGGTAGHTNPGIAIAQALVSAGVNADRIRFVGSRRGNESVLVPAAGFRIDTLNGRGIPRRFSLAAMRAMFQMVHGLGQAVALVKRRRPKVIVCLGGFAAFGPSMAGLLRRVPVVVSEQNARASAVNRLIGKRATVCALPFPGTDLPNGVVTGNPIRSEVVQAVQTVDRRSARNQLDLPADVPVVAVWSGSLGSTSINEAVRELSVLWADKDSVVIYHVIGTRDWEHFGNPPAGLSRSPLDYRTVEYENRMPLLLSAASMAVCRSGASTVAELAVAGLPAVLVPLPNAPRDHQTANARQLSEVGGAVMLEQSDLTAKQLDQILRAWLDDDAARVQAAQASRSAGYPEAADDVARLVIDAGDLHV